MSEERLAEAVASVPDGAWAVGVSGGADSVGVWHALRRYRPDLRLHVVHLDHETRGEASTGDAAFVQALAERWGEACTIGRRSEVEKLMGELPANKSARYRAVRYFLYRKVVEENGLLGVILGHHADDQAETVLHRLLRGAHVPNVVGMEREAAVGGVSILRPMLSVRRNDIREYLKRAGQDWREDASNASGDYLRNRLRWVLNRWPGGAESLLPMHEDMAALRRWVRETAPRLEARFRVEALADWPTLLAAEAARRWLVERGVPAPEVQPGVVQRLIDMARDAAVGGVRQFPGGVSVRRRKGVIQASIGHAELER